MILHCMAFEPRVWNKVTDQLMQYFPAHRACAWCCPWSHTLMSPYSDPPSCCVSAPVKCHTSLFFNHRRLKHAFGAISSSPVTLWITTIRRSSALQIKRWNTNCPPYCGDYAKKDKRQIHIATLRSCCLLKICGWFQPTICFKLKIHFRVVKSF